MSINALPPGKGMPFLHRHERNEEIYFIVGGRAQFLVDGKCFDVEEGAALRILPAAARAWRNNSNEPLYFLVLQYRADGSIEGGTKDGRRADGEPAWPAPAQNT
jgi:mannose-6-phosphate isomerase-like protein (cupin superfamily)